jgi:hypothetical protein
VNSADWRSDVPVGTMDEARPFRILMPAVSLTARTPLYIGPPHPPDPIMGGPKCRSRREARTLRVISNLRLTEQHQPAPIEKDSNPRIRPLAI